MKFSRITHLILSLLLFVTYIWGTFIWCSPHHVYATEGNIVKIEADGESTTHHHKDISSSHSENDDEQDDHCKEGNLGWIDVYIHKACFHDITQVDFLSIIPHLFFRIEEKNDAHFYRERVWIYKRQLYDSDVAYASERKNVIEVLI